MQPSKSMAMAMASGPDEQSDKLKKRKKRGLRSLYSIYLEEDLKERIHGSEFKSDKKARKRNQGPEEEKGKLKRGRKIKKMYSFPSKFNDMDLKITVDDAEDGPHEENKRKQHDTSLGKGYLVEGMLEAALINEEEGVIANKTVREKMHNEFENDNLGKNPPKETTSRGIKTTSMAVQNNVEVHVLEEIVADKKHSSLEYTYLGEKILDGSGLQLLAYAASVVEENTHNKRMEQEKGKKNEKRWRKRKTYDAHESNNKLIPEAAGG
ncbi:PREDICTED: uncharacterized protein LOC104597924 [Nelumbo nucifera]|uniref:Uncharacterized protein LOC104597924 n=2 Tax=Nelumbo nucifera TaxID=4432 RepID=A0A1U8A031_NELNU|nr:PREDICTED: uncharacterized protein LOC104597924 [Nelumbo nucifera]DAD31479.1 TPA_asm: hypothetical protein HUJ06_010330 [Nelumbo nucifera]